MKIWHFIACFAVLHWWSRKHHWDNAASKWLYDHGLSAYEEILIDHGATGLLDLADERWIPSIPGEAGDRLRAGSSELYERLVFNYWLTQAHHDDKADWLLAEQVASLSDLLERSDAVLQADPSLARAVAEVPTDPDSLVDFKRQLFEELRSSVQPPRSSWVSAGMLLRFAAAVLAALLVDFLYRLWRDAVGHETFVAPLRRLLQLTLRCRVQLLWEDRRRVGGVVSFLVKAERLDGRSYDLRADSSALHVQVHVRASPVSCALEWRAADLVSCSFPARTAGTYVLSVTVNGRHVEGSPFRRRFLADLPDAEKTTLLSHSSTVVMTQGHQQAMVLDLRDRFSNPCEREDWTEIRPLLTVSVAELDDGQPVVAYEQLEPPLVDGGRATLRLVLPREGCFRATVSCDGRPVRRGHLYLVVLSAFNMAAVRKHVSTRSVSFAARLTCVDGRPLNKPKDVWCYVSPKQLTIRETVLLFLQRKLYTFRLCPSTRLTPTNEQNATSLPSLTVTDGCQPPLELTLPQRDQLAATFTQFLLRNVGGSETFADKRRHLYRELEHANAGRSRRALALHVRRAALLESSMAALRGASSADWARPFEVRFDDEEALDYGGVRREWSELVCEALFEPRGRLFAPLADGGDASQALVHPCAGPQRPQRARLRHFEFAGRLVGKCLLESAQGGAARQLVRARFTRSFLAQLIGLNVTYKHFEQDDPELFRTKIALIEACSADELAELELTFTDEEFDAQGRLVQTVELRSGGARTAVTVDNRLEYLQCLAQHRLRARCRSEVDAFLRGLNELVPDHLLSIFDENELELLMCGSSEFSVAELRRHHTVTDHSAGFEKVLGWFWTALENFSAEEASRLLQFTTGCARLPAGGFAELSPKFQISSYHEFGALPVAHTCFNQLCLADHDSYQTFERALLLALREGNVGFGLL